MSQSQLWTSVKHFYALGDACDTEVEALVRPGWERRSSLPAGIFEWHQEATSPRPLSDSAPLHAHPPQTGQETCTSNSSSPPRAEAMAYRSVPPVALWPLWGAAACPWLSSQGTRAAPLPPAPLGRYPAVLFWDSHVSACDRGMNGPFCSAGDKGWLQPPSETPRKTAIFWYSQLLSLKHNSVSRLILRVT